MSQIRNKRAFILKTSWIIQEYFLEQLLFILTPFFLLFLLKMHGTYLLVVIAADYLFSSFNI